MLIKQIQDEITHEIAKLNGDIELILLYIIGLGQILPTMPEEYRADSNIIKGCHSNVWLVSSAQEDKIHFYADSDTIISKGLVSLLLRIVNGQHPNEILNADFYVIRQTHLERFMGTKRSNGLSAMIDQIKICALKHKSGSKDLSGV